MLGCGALPYDREGRLPGSASCLGRRSLAHARADFREGTLAISFAKLVLSYGGCGLLPKIPGTWGTAGAAITAWLFLEYWPGAVTNWPWLCAAWVVLASAVTVLLTPVIEAESGVKDPQLIVTDEVAGYWATLALVPRPDVTVIVAAFFVFRFFDVWKPFPARRLERLPSGWGVLLDDVMAGVYGAAILWGLGRVIVLS